MATPNALELKDGYAIFRPEGEATVTGAVLLIRQAMWLCQESAVTRLLIDLRGLTHPVLTTLDRFRLMSDVAEFWDRRIAFAMVIRPDQSDPEKFGELVARNRALRLTVHNSEAEALQALMAV